MVQFIPVLKHYNLLERPCQGTNRQFFNKKEEKNTEKKNKE